MSAISVTSLADAPLLDAAAPAAGGRRGVLEALRTHVRQGRDVALALVLDTSGSTYRKAGALALHGDGVRHGVLSGGCLEPALERVARAALACGDAQLVELDTQSDADLVFGSGSGCRGRMRVLVLPLRDARDPSGIASALLRVLDGAHVRLAIAVDAVRIADSHAWVDGASSGAHAFAALRDASAGVHRVESETTPCEVAVLDFAPPPHVLLLGAGPEAPLLARLGRELGWRVTVADHRPALCRQERLPAADRLLCAKAPAALAQLAHERIDAAVVMTHLASVDADALRALAAREIGYVDLLGPRARRDELLAQLDPGERSALAERVHGPAGLALGGEGPEAIALAIAAGLQRHFGEIGHVA